MFHHWAPPTLSNISTFLMQPACVTNPCAHCTQLVSSIRAAMPVSHLSEPLLEAIFPVYKEYITILLNLSEDGSQIRAK